MSYMDILKAQLIVDESKRNKMYNDSEGIPTIGIGHNLRDNPISDAAVNQIFADDIAPIEAQTRAMFPSFDTLSDARKAVLCNMMFNMGPKRFATFVTLPKLVAAKQFAAAADNMLTTLWAKQVGARAIRLANAMRAG